MHHDPVDPPDCPVCEQAAVKNRVRPEQLGPWWCESCCLIFYGTSGEFERYEVHRLRRRQLREETAADGT